MYMLYEENSDLESLKSYMRNTMDWKIGQLPQQSPDWIFCVPFYDNFVYVIGTDLEENSLREEEASSAISMIFWTTQRA